MASADVCGSGESDPDGSHQRVGGSETDARCAAEADLESDRDRFFVKGSEPVVDRVALEPNGTLGTCPFPMGPRTRCQSQVRRTLTTPTASSANLWCLFYFFCKSLQTREINERAARTNKSRDTVRKESGSSFNTVSAFSCSPLPKKRCDLRHFMFSIYT